MATFIVCPGCDCPAKQQELSCPHCGVALPGADGPRPRTAAAIILGLATAISGCGEVTPEYGVAATGGGDAGGGVLGGGGAGEGGEPATGGAPEGGAGGAAAPLYGVAGTGGAGGSR